MAMTNPERELYEARHLLALAASNEPSTLLRLCEQAGIEPHPGTLALARRMLSRSVGAGTWREVRAEAEAELRFGYRGTNRRTL